MAMQRMDNLMKRQVKKKNGKKVKGPIEVPQLDLFRRAEPAAVG
jgi:hypothetical protein